jgi:hypothetical protein
MKEELHKKNLEESIEVIEECVEKGMLAERQRTLGFHCSAAAVDLLEILLHRHNLISPGAQLKHDWFSSPKKVSEKFVFDFPHKNKILPIIMDIEKNRNLLCYGKPQPEEVVEAAVLEFRKLLDILRSEVLK